MEKTNEKLSRLDSFLIVIDNADKPDQVKKLLPRVVNQGQGRKHVVITSRSKEWKEVASVVVVNVPSEEEALRMLESHSGRKNVVGGEESKALVREVGWQGIKFKNMYLRLGLNAFCNFESLGNFCAGGGSLGLGVKF